MRRKPKPLPKSIPADKKTAAMRPKQHDGLLLNAAASALVQLPASDRRRDIIHPSDLAKKNWCPRSAYYSVSGVEATEQSFSLSREVMFAEGHEIHHKWQRWMWLAGLLTGEFFCSACMHVWFDTAPPACRQCGAKAMLSDGSTLHVHYREFPVKSDEYMIAGRSDGGIGEDALMEIKSIGMGTVRIEDPSLYYRYTSKELTFDGVWREIRRPFPSHLRQGVTYLECTGRERMHFIYEWKSNQMVKEFVIKSNRRIIADRLDGCVEVRKHLDKGAPPPRPSAAESPTSSFCKECGYRAHCWGVQDVEVAVASSWRFDEEKPSGPRPGRKAA